jgi:hypothetical protein
MSALPSLPPSESPESYSLRPLPCILTPFIASFTTHDPSPRCPPSRSNAVAIRTADPEADLEMDPETDLELEIDLDLDFGQVLDLDLNLELDLDLEINLDMMMDVRNCARAA